MGFTLFKFFLSALAIIVAGSFLTRFSDKIAEITGWGRMFVGGLLLAGATSLPELMVDLKSIELDLPNLAVGDLLGSCLFNLLILSVLDFAYPSTFRRTAFSPKYLHHALAAVLSIVLTSIVAIGIASRHDISFFGINLFLWATILAYLYGLRLIFIERAQASTSQDQDSVEPLPAEASPFDQKKKKLAFAFLGYLACASVIFFSAPFLVSAADQLSEISGLGHTFIGTTLVALSTSLPELITTLTAFRIGAPDLALANIFGSNAFNMILFAPLDFFYSKSLFKSVSPQHIITAISVVIATSVAVMGQLYRKIERSRFTEPSSETVVVVIIFALYLLYKI